MQKATYTAPILEPHPDFVALTGISLPIGNSSFTEPMDFLENMDFMETEQ